MYEKKSLMLSRIINNMPNFVTNHYAPQFPYPHLHFCLSPSYDSLFGREKRKLIGALLHDLFSQFTRILTLASSSK